jgi:hypothetical protein
MPAFSTLKYILSRWRTAGDGFWDRPAKVADVALEANESGTVTQEEIDEYVLGSTADRLIISDSLLFCPATSRGFLTTMRHEALKHCSRCCLHLRHICTRSLTRSLHLRFVPHSAAKLCSSADTTNFSYLPPQPQPRQKTQATSVRRSSTMWNRHTSPALGIKFLAPPCQRRNAGLRTTSPHAF